MVKGVQKKLFTPAQIGRITLKHRVVMPPMSRLRAQPGTGGLFQQSSFRLHLGQPKRRFSKPSFRVSVWISAIRVLHREQRGRSITAIGTGDGLRNEAMKPKRPWRPAVLKELACCPREIEAVLG
jgi:hypothetical protein